MVHCVCEVMEYSRCC